MLHKTNQPIVGSSPTLIKVMMDAGIVPDHCRRIVLDIAYNNVVKIYYEVLGDNRLLDVDFASHIGAMIKEAHMIGESEDGKT